jgi:MarR family transcriptional regulator, organic hydroperoxide resistance regulator
MLNFRDNIVFMIAKAHQQAQGFLKVRLKSFGLTPVQCLVLESLWDEEGQPVGEIGRRLVLDTATLAGVLDRMVTAGWVRREIDPGDARVARIYLSEKANAITLDLAKTIEQSNNDLLSNFSMEEKLLFKRFLRDINGKG